MNREEKAAVIEKITTDIKESEAIFVVDYRGLTVPQAAELRAKLRDADTSLRIVKNTLTERAADQADAAELKTLLVGPTAIAFVRGDAALAAKALAQAQKDYDILEFKGGSMGGAALTADEIKALSKLPSRDALIGQLVGLTASPLVGIVRSLGGLIGGLASQLGQIRDQGLVGKDAPAAEEAPAEAAADEAPADDAATDSAAQEAVAEDAAAETEAEEVSAEGEADGEAAADQSAEADEAEGDDTTGEQEDGEPAAEEAPEDKASAEGDADGDAPAEEVADEEGDGADGADA